MYKFAHIADCHLGANREPVLQKLELAAFKNTFDKCVEKKVDFIIISGDLFHVNIPDMGVVNDLSSFSATLIRLGRGLNSAVTADKRREPKEPLQLYDFEGCPYCRKVREVLCELDLDYLSLPTARGSTRRLELRALGGKVQVPYLVDPNTGAQLYESDEIIAYLNRTYGATSRAGSARAARCAGAAPRPSGASRSACRANRRRRAARTALRCRPRPSRTCCS